MPCPTCPSAPVEYDSASGASYCTQCGTVLEESTITAEVGFVEGGDGSARMVGQFVSAERSGLSTFTGRNRRLNANDSREETIANARRRIHEVATALRGLGEYHIERAVQCYKLALMHQFTQGRKQAHVVAACLYIVCRQEKTTHMLIDFSDVLETNVFILGNTFLKLCRTLNIQLPLIDPSLFLSRFAAQLELGDKLHAVTNDALRLVQRMKRDWIHYGRRPSGICGACLLLACRMHGFKRSEAEVIRIVKICEATLRKRLMEFAETASAELSIEQFRNTDLSTEANPPSFRRPTKKKLILKSIEEDEEEAGELNGDQNEKDQEKDGGDEDNDDVEREFSETMKTIDPSPLPPISLTWVDKPVDVDISKWTDLDIDDEVSTYMLSEREQQLKRSIWEEMNADWERKQLEKRNREEDGEVKKRKKRTYSRRSVNVMDVSRAQGGILTVAEASKAVLTQKAAPRISKKINYAALEEFIA